MNTINYYNLSLEIINSMEKSDGMIFLNEIVAHGINNILNCDLPEEQADELRQIAQQKIRSLEKSTKMIYHVHVNACDFGFITATDAQNARDQAAQMAGYKSEADMEIRLGQPSEFIALVVEGATK